MTIDNKTVENILSRTDLTDIENQIAIKTGQYVNRDNWDFTIGIVKRDIINSRLEIEELISIFEKDKEKLTDFGIELLSRNKLKDEITKLEVIESHGLGIGFAIQYAIYFKFLADKRTTDLTDYIKKSRIPNATNFSRQLRTIFDNMTK